LLTRKNTITENAPCAQQKVKTDINTFFKVETKHRNHTIAVETVVTNNAFILKTMEGVVESVVP
jgi:hypothetical protein